jgi:predicted dehydrogenase
MSSRLSIAPIGLGTMGRNHAKALAALAGKLDNVTVATAFDPDPAARDHAEALGLALSNNLAQALSGAQAAVVASPTSTHAQVLQAVGATVPHVFLEKPLAATLAEAEALAACVAAQGLHVQLGFIERFNPVVRALQGALCQVAEPALHADFVRTGKGSARITDVDVVSDLMIHDIDLALWLFGPVARVEAAGVRQQGLLELASATLTHTSGTVSRLHASRITHKRERRVTVTLAEQWLHADLLTKTLQSVQQVADPAKPGWFNEATTALPVPTGDALQDELRAFVLTCQGREAEVNHPGVPQATDGLAAQRVCDAIQRAVP